MHVLWSIICILWVCLYRKTVWILCMCCSSVWVHLFSSGLYIYIQSHVSVSAVRGYRPVFCVQLTGVTPNCTPSPVMQGICSEFGVSKHFNLRKVHIDSIWVFLSLRYCQCTEYSSLPGQVCVCCYVCMLFCAQSDNNFAGSSHSYSVTQSGVCAFSIHPIHSVICRSPGLTTCGNRTVHHIK